MMLHRRSLIRRAALKAEAAAREVGAKVEKTAEELAAERRAIAEAARKEFVAAYDRFAATLRDLSAHGDDAADAVVEGMERPIADVEHALDVAHTDLEAQAEKAREAEGADLHQG